MSLIYIAVITALSLLVLYFISFLTWCPFPGDTCHCLPRAERTAEQRILALFALSFSQGLQCPAQNFCHYGHTSGSMCTDVEEGPSECPEVEIPMQKLCTFS